ncbi:hypothetical protein [Botrimarina hoheduenensis]|uniref:Uncharacterized protein n=1 Tax=Botrimarina hoheduenensis TaxID=2528000 RepID=A0A5C5VSG0_9BACT|nr:hypothetical protein [Botrimarina hoheduenensis]TWT41548.1 hypothetical protein Pla111_29250 [Botrimarina hoheduenensis]
MTTVRPLTIDAVRRDHAMGKLVLAVGMLLVPSLSLLAQSPPTHRPGAGAIPPGAIGAQRLMRGGPLLGYTQPVELRAPEGIILSAVSGAGYSTAHDQRMLVGMAVGCVYGFKAVGVPSYPEIELYPSVELVDRLYPPPGKALRFPVPIELTADDLRIAAQGGLVTRVIYVEDPRTALPVVELNGQQWFEARTGDDPLALADAMGRPIAILRIGSRLASPGGSAFAEPMMLAKESTDDPRVLPATASLP